MSDEAVTAACDEDQWRASLYALIGRLFFDAPDRELLEHLAAGATAPGDTPLEQAWRQLAAVGAAADVTALRREHAMLFIGVGKSPVTPYTSAYVIGVSPERHLLLLRQQLESWGLAGDAASATPEDHISGLCDTLRHLILRAEPIPSQKEFFNKFIYLQSIAVCDRLTQAAPSLFYVEVACLTRAFLEVEREGFDMLAA